MGRPLLLDAEGMETLLEHLLLVLSTSSTSEALVDEHLPFKQTKRARYPTEVPKFTYFTHMGEKLTLPEFNTLVERFYPDLTKRAIRLCRDYTIAEDAVQNTLLFAFEKQKEGKFEKLDQKAYDIQFRAWLYKMLSNMVYYMFSRRSGASKPNYQKYAYASFVYFNDRNMRSFSSIDCGEMFGRSNQESETEYIMKAINELPLGFPHGITGRVVPSRYQEIAKMAFIDGLTAPEIGALMGLADATIRSRISHIRQILKEKLAPVMQLADISASKAGSCGFESHPEYQN